MPTRKKTVNEAAPVAAPAAKPAPRRRAAAKPVEIESAVEPTAPAKIAKTKPAPAVKAEKSPAATHKSPAKRTPAPEKVSAAFDIEAHRTEIELEAYFLWERRGRLDGASFDDWAQALEIVRTRYQ